MNGILETFLKFESIFPYCIIIVISVLFSDTCLAVWSEVCPKSDNVINKLFFIFVSLVNPKTTWYIHHKKTNPVFLVNVVTQSLYKTHRNYDTCCTRCFVPSLYVKSFDSCVNRKCSLHSGLQLSWLFRIPCGVWPSLWNWKKVRVPVFSDNLKILVSVSGTVVVMSLLTTTGVSIQGENFYVFYI